MMRSTCLAAILLAAGCFSEPSSASTSDADDDDTGTGSTSVDGSSTEAGDEGSTTFFFGSSTTGLFLTSTGFGTTADTSTSDTGDPSPLFDIYEQCDEGFWETSDGTNLETSTCLHTPMDENTAGGGWQYPEFPLGGDANVLILRPHPVDAGFLRATFNTGDLDIVHGATLHLEYRYVNTDMKDNGVGTMTFRVLLNPPNASPGDGMLIREELAQGNDTQGTIDVSLDIAGTGDDLVFAVVADTYAPGQGIALTNAFIYEAP